MAELKRPEKFFSWTDEEMEVFPTLPHPQNVLEMTEGQEVKFRFTRFEYYKTDIHPRFPGAPVTKRVVALRCWLREPYRWFGLPWVDITATRLVSQIEPMLKGPDIEKKLIYIKKVGEKPKAQFSVGYEEIE